jgi:hypothetical protein
MKQWPYVYCGSCGYDWALIRNKDNDEKIGKRKKVRLKGVFDFLKSKESEEQETEEVIGDKFEVIPDIYIKTSDRIFIAGKSGSGKSILAKDWLIPGHYSRYVFHDVKKESEDLEHDIINKNPKELESSIKQYQKILYQPIDLDPKDFNNVCKTVYQNKNNMLAVDEVSRYATPSKIEYWHNVLISQGRSYNVGNINIAQRPRFVHNSVMSEAEHYFIFSLNLDTDIKKLETFMGKQAGNEIRALPEFHFLYYNVREHGYMIFNPIE